MRPCGHWPNACYGAIGESRTLYLVLTKDVHFLLCFEGMVKVGRLELPPPRPKRGVQPLHYTKIGTPGRTRTCDAQYVTLTF